MHINVHRTVPPLSVLVISLTKNPPLRHRAAKGNSTFLLNPISGYRIRLSTLPRDEIRDQCASRAEGDGRNKSTRETIPFRPAFRSQKSLGLRTDEWQVRPVSRIGSVPGPLMRYFIGHNPPFTGGFVPLSSRNESGVWYRWLYLSSWHNRAPLATRTKEEVNVFLKFTNHERYSKINFVI